MKVLVIARYKESLDWVEQVPKDWFVMVIQKGDGGLPNVGREPHSFLHYILEHYDGIEDDYLFCFVQGNPLDHCPALIEELTRCAWKETVELFGYAGLGAHWHTSDGKGRPAHSGLPVDEYYQRWTGREFPVGGVRFVAGGQFIVSGKAIKRIPKSKYAEMYEDVQHGQVAWVAERTWEELFVG